MIKFSDLKLEEVFKKIDFENKKVHTIDFEIDLPELLKKEEIDINNDLLPLKNYLILYDESIKMVLTIHELLEKKTFDTKSNHTLLILSSKVLSSLIAIRKLLHSGLVDSTKNINRTLLETIDIFFACIIDSELNRSFGNTELMYDNNDFYWKNLTSKKLSLKCSELFKKLKINTDYIDYLLERRKNLKSFLSESIHSSFNSSFVTYLMFDLNFDIENKKLGKVTTAYPKMLMALIEDIYIFTEIFQNSVEQNITEELSNLKSYPFYVNYLLYYNKFMYVYKNYHKILDEESNQHSQYLNKLSEIYKSKNDI